MTKVDILIIITENHLHLNTTSFKLPYLRHCRIYKRDSQAKSAIFHTEKSSKKTNFNCVCENIYLKLMQKVQYYDSILKKVPKKQTLTVLVKTFILSYSLQNFLFHM